MGVYPKMFFKKMDTSVQGFLAFVKERNASYETMETKPAKVAITPAVQGLGVTMEKRAVGSQ
jgi:hypothetical protein